MSEIAKKPVFRFKRKYFSFPYIAICAIFVVLPLCIMLAYAFRGEDGQFTLENFVYFFSHAENLKVLLFSFVMAVLNSGICLLMAYPLALCLANSKINKSAILAMMFILPMWINSLLRTYALQNLLIDLFGIQRGFLSALVGLVYDFFPFMLLPIYTTLSNMDKSVIEASADLGAGTLTTFFKIKLPLSLPGIVSGMLMVFMPTMSNFSVTEIMGNMDTYMIGSMINELINGGDWSGSAAYSFILLILVGITMVISNVITGDSDSSAGLGGVL